MMRVGNSGGGVPQFLFQSQAVISTDVARVLLEWLDSKDIAYICTW